MPTRAYDPFTRPSVKPYDQRYYVPKQTFEQMNGPNSTRRHKPRDRVFVKCLNKPAVVLYNLNDSFIQVDTGTGPILIYEEDVLTVQDAIDQGLTDRTHDAFFDAYMPGFQARFLAAMSDKDREAYIRYNGGSGIAGDDEPGRAGDAPW